MVDTTRRKLLLATGATAASAGCVLNPLSDDETSDDETENEHENTSGSNRTDSNKQNTTTQNESATQTNESETGNTSDQANATTEDHNETNTTTNESADEDGERQELPDDEDKEIDRERYDNDTGPREVEELPQDYVSITATYGVGSGGSVVVEGEATNESDELIDFVDVEILYYDENESVIGSDLAVVRELDIGETKSFEKTTWASDLDGDVEKVGGIPHPQNYK